jgi:hypothetical protein
VVVVSPGRTFDKFAFISPGRNPGLLTRGRHHFERNFYDKPSRQMALTSGSSEMSIRKFDETNFNFWKEQMQDYLIVRGQIDPIEHDTALATYKAASLDEVGQCLSRHYSDTSLGIRILYGPGVYDS